MRFAVLVSGTGSNLQALLEAQERGEIDPANIALVVSNRPNVPALARANRFSVPARVVDHTQFSSRTAFETELGNVVRGHGIQAVVLAGFMRILTETFVSQFPNRILNTHPALCPAFPGIHAPKQALDHGVKVTGCTVHFVDAGVDTGPIVLQECVVIEQDDTPESLHKRIQSVEHRLLPEAVQLLADGKLIVDGRRVRQS